MYQSDILPARAKVKEVTESTLPIDIRGDASKNAHTGISAAGTNRKAKILLRNITSFPWDKILNIFSSWYLPLYLIELMSSSQSLRNSEELLSFVSADEVRSVV
mmetsp:Transcript_6371/g.15463  ORF Transcript_6371/g.15463 Transcript_6371/m.15463 type:complete len:104 (-) Transcript_6371:255-566(-)